MNYGPGYLDLSGRLNELDNDTFYEFLRDQRVKTVDLARNNLTDRDIGSLCQALRGNTNINTLVLSMNKISPNGAGAIVDAIRSSNVKMLHLDYSEIGDQGALAIGNALDVISPLTNLSLAGNKISVKGAISLFSKGLTYSKITHLDLSFNPIGDTSYGAIEVLGAQCAITNLQNIKLNKCDLTEKQVAYFAKMLSTIVPLRSLSLYSNPIDITNTDIIAELARSIEGSNLIVFDIDSTSLSIKNALAKNFQKLTNPCTIEVHNPALTRIFSAQAVQQSQTNTNTRVEEPPKKKRKHNSAQASNTNM